MSSDRLSEKQVAKRFGVTPSTLANWRWRGYGPPFLKVGRRVQYVDSDVQAWEEAQRRDPSSAA
jgi:DNA-binding transcriptional regulator YiaG